MKSNYYFIDPIFLNLLPAVPQCTTVAVIFQSFSISDGTCSVISKSTIRFQNDNIFSVKTLSYFSSDINQVYYIPAGDKVIN